MSHEGMTPPQSKLSEWGYTLTFMCGVTLIVMTMVAGLSQLTAERVARNERLFLKRAVMEAARGAPADKDPATVEQWFAAAARPMGTDAKHPAFAIVEPASGATQGYVVVASGPGLWGRITAAVGLDAARDTFTGLAFTEEGETPGLGARIEEPWFKRQVRGKRGPLGLRPEGTRSAEATEIDAITGATVTSRAVRDILNRTRGTASTGAPR